MSIEFKGITQKKSYAFAVKIVKLYQHLSANKKEFVLSKQLLRSGTAICALVREAEHAQSHADFINKLNIALKEANETSYWLTLLKDTDYLGLEQYNVFIIDSQEIVKILAASIKTLKAK
jgi:four helix bundle protein